MENRDRFLQPIQDSDRQGERNSRVFFKATAIQAFCQLNSDRDEIFSFACRSAPNLNFGQTNFLEQFRLERKRI